MAKMMMEILIIGIMMVLMIEIFSDVFSICKIKIRQNHQTFP